jgi:hypothetical protein
MHVPNLWKNFIPLGVLKEMVAIAMENKVLKVVPGSLVVKMRILHIHFYPLIDETVTGDLAVGIGGSKDQTKCMRI